MCTTICSLGGRDEAYHVSGQSGYGEQSPTAELCYLTYGKKTAELPATNTVGCAVLLSLLQIPPGTSLFRAGDRTRVERFQL